MDFHTAFIDCRKDDLSQWALSAPASSSAESPYFSLHRFHMTSFRAWRSSMTLVLAIAQIPGNGFKWVLAQAKLHTQRSQIERKTSQIHETRSIMQSFKGGFRANQGQASKVLSQKCKQNVQPELQRSRRKSQTRSSSLQPCLIPCSLFDWKARNFGSGKSNQMHEYSTQQRSASQDAIPTTIPTFGIFPNCLRCFFASAVTSFVDRG